MLAYDSYWFERDACRPARGCDFVLVNLFRDPVGAPMRPGAVNELLAALSRRAGLEREISIVPRENANGARAKSGGRAVPAGGELIRLYADYLHLEYGDIDSDYVLSGCRDNTYCPEPGVIWILCLKFASDQPLFAGEVRIIFWLYRIVINRVW